MYRDSAGGDNTIDDLLKVIDELERVNTRTWWVNPNQAPKTKSRMLEERWSSMNHWVRDVENLS